jgi:hypothetical protein
MKRLSTTAPIDDRKLKSNFVKMLATQESIKQIMTIITMLPSHWEKKPASMIQKRFLRVCAHEYKRSNSVRSELVIGL